MGGVFAIQIPHKKSWSTRRKKVLYDLCELSLSHLIDRGRSEYEGDFCAALRVRIGDAQRSLTRSVAKMNRVKSLVGELFYIMIGEIGLKAVAKNVVVGC